MARHTSVGERRPAAWRAAALAAVGLLIVAFAAVALQVISTHFCRRLEEDLGKCQGPCSTFELVVEVMVDSQT